MKPYRTLNIILISAWLLSHIINFAFNVSNWENKPHLSYPPVNKLKPIDPVISTDLPYSQFKELKTQQQIARSLKNGDYSGASANLIGIVGTGSGVMLCDTCTIKGPIKFIPKTPRYYYIALHGWKLKSTTSPVPDLDSVIFHVEHGQAYIRKNVVSSETDDTGKKTYTTEVKDVPVKFRYSHKSQMLKIPVSKQVKDALVPIIYFFNIALILYGVFNALLLIQLLISLVGGSSFALNIWWKSIFFLLAFPFFILYIVVKILRLLWRDSSNTKWSAEEFVFTSYNIFRLRILAYSLVGIPMFFLSLNLFMHLIYNSYFTTDVVINSQRLQPWSTTMDVGFILLLILHVFMQGKALKNEQDLTV